MPLPDKVVAALSRSKLRLPSGTIRTEEPNVQG